MRTTPSGRLTVLTTTALLVMLPTSRTQGNEPTDPSFELLDAGTTIGGTLVFSAQDVWTNCPGRIATAENGGTPLDGDQMLAFTQTSQASADIYQIIDAIGLPETVELSAWFNATATQAFSVTLLTYDESELPIGINDFEQAASSCDFDSDDDPATWERVTIRLTIPPTTGFLAVGINATITGTPSYADMVSLTRACPDLDGNGQVGFADVIDLLSDWGTCPACTCPADVTLNGSVGFDDLLKVLAAWGPCVEAGP